MQCTQAPSKSTRSVLSTLTIHSSSSLEGSVLTLLQASQPKATLVPGTPPPVQSAPTPAKTPTVSPVSLTISAMKLLFRSRCCLLKKCVLLGTTVKLSGYTSVLLVISVNRALESRSVLKASGLLVCEVAHANQYQLATGTT